MRALAIACVALALAACASTPQGALNPTQSAAIVVAKGEYAFEVAYNGAAKAWLAAPPAVPADKKAAARKILLEMLSCDPAGQHCTGYVQLARDAVRASDVSTAAAQAAQVSALAGQVIALLATESSK